MPGQRKGGLKQTVTRADIEPLHPASYLSLPKSNRTPKIRGKQRREHRLAWRKEPRWKWLSPIPSQPLQAYLPRLSS
jgi:hypothetical protein